MACVSSEDGKPLMPAKRRGKVKRLLKDGRAEVAKLEASAI
ncbi:MAG: RRXRR domain-containing protein [Clostridiales bacterium]|nr:RRXRR domain-containing protein [Clostridiales bacterium]